MPHSSAYGGAGCGRNCRHVTAGDEYLAESVTSSTDGGAVFRFCRTREDGAALDVQVIYILSGSVISVVTDC